MKTFKQSIIAVVVGLAMAYGIGLAWTGPTADPAANNVPAPINVGLLPQTFGDSSSAGSKTLNMGNGSGVLSIAGALRIAGILSADSLGLGTNYPTSGYKLEARGPIIIKDGTEGANKVLTSNINGGTRWEMPARKFPAPDYDSGWEFIGNGVNGDKNNIVPKTHNLGDNTMVYIEGKNANGEIHQSNLGTDNDTGLKILSKTSSNIVVKRAPGDSCSTHPNSCWKQFRILMWKW